MRPSDRIYMHPIGVLERCSPVHNNTNFALQKRPCPPAITKYRVPSTCPPSRANGKRNSVPPTVTRDTAISESTAGTRMALPSFRRWRSQRATNSCHARATSAMVHVPTATSAPLHTTRVRDCCALCRPPVARQRSDSGSCGYSQRCRVATRLRSSLSTTVGCLLGWRSILPLP